MFYSFEVILFLGEIFQENWRQRKGCEPSWRYVVYVTRQLTIIRSVLFCAPCVINGCTRIAPALCLVNTNKKKVKLKRLRVPTIAPTNIVRLCPTFLKMMRRQCFGRSWPRVKQRQTSWNRWIPKWTLFWKYRWLNGDDRGNEKRPVSNAALTLYFKELTKVDSQRQKTEPKSGEEQREGKFANSWARASWERNGSYDNSLSFRFLVSLKRQF